MKLAAAASTHQGQIRSGNEDSFLIDDTRAVFAIADGMGGHRGGATASRTAIESLRASMAHGAALNDAITTANTAVISRASEDSELTGMGTTMTAVQPISGRKLLIGHVGDSRAYALRDGTLRRVTEDHSLVEELVRDGRLTPEQAESHPQRAIVTRALGVDDKVEVDVYVIDVDPGDRLVLCSDGLNTMFRDRDIERIARGETEPQHAADALVDAANEAGGEDNITVVIVDVIEVDDEEPVVPGALESSEPEEAPAAPAAVPEPDNHEAEALVGKRSRMRTVRGVILVVVPLILIIGFAAGALGWYARRSYFVGVDNNHVVVYKGVPGGVLGWDPTIEQRTGIDVDELPELQRARVETNATRGSLATATAYVARLNESITTTTTSTTSTTVPRRRTTRPTSPSTTTPRG